MSTKKERMYQQIEAHGKNLVSLMGSNGKYIDGMKLCKVLFRLENAANRMATKACNGEITTEAWLRYAHDLKIKVKTLLGGNLPVEINGDARGYTLKLDDNFCRDKQIYRDMGGYGILAPDFREVRS